jgi:hypothetical protein
MLQVNVLLALFGLAHAASDPQIFNVKQLTKFDGESAFPMFRLVFN